MAFPDPFTAALLQAVVLLAIVRALDVYEREPVRILAVMALWGAVGATSLSLVGNGIVDGLLPEDVAAVWGAAISAPLVEEVAKGIALVVAFLASASCSCGSTGFRPRPTCSSGPRSRTR
jgi:RsiW-degrading membrane proteinase PrsW (M82 family)